VPCGERCRCLDCQNTPGIYDASQANRLSKSLSALHTPGSKLSASAASSAAGSAAKMGGVGGGMGVGVGMGGMGGVGMGGMGGMGKGIGATGLGSGFMHHR
jgi:hypothetical protein